MTLLAKELILFPSPSYLGFVGSKRDPTACLPHGHSSSTLWRFINIKEIEINNDDLNFLEIVDDYRAWRMEEQFKMGERWSFSSHQFRRTLAYYCRQSGLVKLSTLKRHLKYITREMSLYYAQGNEYSELFDTNEHFYKEHDRSRPEVDTFAYVLELLLSEETVYGSHGNHIERFNKPKSEQEKIKILSNQGDIVKKFKNGEIAYQETALGACTTTSPCNKKLLGHISACIKCTDAVLKPSKVQNVINYQSKFVESLAQNSIGYRTEKKELEALLLQQNKMVKRG
jgi:arsenate reductase-like glutaredoxin family protein